MTTLHPLSRPVRVIDRLLDLLLVSMLLGAPLIFYTRGNDVFEFNKITAVRDLSALALLLFMVKLLWVRPFSLLRGGLERPLLLTLAVSLVATFNTINWRLSVHGVYEDFEGITTVIHYAFLLVLTQQHVRSERQINLFLGAVVLAGTVAGFYGILQNFGIDFVPWNPDTYSKTRMFSTMGNPNFLAAYLVMSLPICFVMFLDLPERIRVDKNFTALLVIVGLAASVGLCALFDVNYFNFDPKFYEAESFGQMLFTQKFIATKLLLAFPLIAAGLLYNGRLRFIILLSMLFQVVAILFTKSRGGVISLSVLAAVFGLAFAWESGRAKGVLIALGAALLGLLAFYSGIWRWFMTEGLVEHRLVGLIVVMAVLAGLARWASLRATSQIIRDNAWTLSVFLLLIWMAHYNDAIRGTSMEMLDRFHRLFDFKEFKYTPRLFIWRSALAILRDHFWFGTGLDTFQLAFPPYRLALYWNLEWNGTPEKAHNMVMQIAATMGFSGLVAFFWMKAAFLRRSYLDWRSQEDPRKRLLIVACLAAVLAFLAQNLFSFTVVGYGALYWMLMGFLPAMAATWRQTPPEAAAPEAGPELDWRLTVGLLGLTSLAMLLAGPDFFVTQNAWSLRLLLTLAGLVCLGVVVASGSAQMPSWARLGTAVTVGIGMFFFAMHSTKIWVADSFYKQGQVGMAVNQPGYAALMYQKASGRLLDINTQAQLESIHQAVTPTPKDLRLRIDPGLNPDQELYWVKMGIAFENAAAQAPNKDEKTRYLLTALAIHHLTLEMNPVNGYNFNNKGRVLRAMGEATGNPQYYQRALEHYARAVSLDGHNVYFNLDQVQTFVALGDLNRAMEVVLSCIQRFPDFGLPYAHAGFIFMRAGKLPEAKDYLTKALSYDFRGDRGQRGLAGVNLGLLEARAGNDQKAQAAYMVAIEANPGLQEAYINLAQLHLSKGRRPQGIEVLKRLLQVVPGQPQATQTLKSLGAL